MKSQHTSLKHLLALTFMVHFRDVVQLTNRGLSKSGMFQKLFFQDHRVTPFLGKMGGLFNVQRARGDVGPKKCGSSGEESTNKTRFFFGVCEFGKMMCHKRATCVCEWALFCYLLFLWLERVILSVLNKITPLTGARRCFC